MSHFLTCILLLFAINHSIYCSYHYVGCYTQVFHDSYFTSSFMEPTLCFRLCDTPIIYLQKTICRCSGGGLMHYNRQNDKLCLIPCTQPVDRLVKSVNTCGGASTYSAYVQEKFYSYHGHLFDYQIQFASCELWKTKDAYEIYEVQFDQTIVQSSLNRLEQCAAACLDQNATTKSIAFNRNSSNKCSCIMPLKINQGLDRAYYLTILPNSSCDLYCNNTFEGSKNDLKYQCGSLNNSQIWAIYDLNGSCPMNFIYIKELKKCIYTFKNFWNSCTPPSTSYIYDGSLNWKDFLKVIGRLQLNTSAVTIDFDEDVIIDQSWKCFTSTTSNVWGSYYSQQRSTLYGWSSHTRYILENGCLRDGSSTLTSSWSHRYSNRLCITDAINKFAQANDEDNNGTYISAINPQIKFCPTNWFDLNGRCYRMSDERKTIEQAKTSCINISITSETSIESNRFDRPKIWLIDSNGHVIGGEELNDSPAGEIVEYVSQWQARLGFFLLDTDPDHDNDKTDTTTTASMANLYYDDTLVSSDDNDSISDVHGSIDEFQVINYDENKNTCVVITRSSSEVEEKPIIKSIQTDQCTQPRHVLCETNTLIVQNFQYACLKKPNVLDLPALISSQLTHELCLSVCQELQTKLAILHINKCYCLQGARPNLINITTDFPEQQQKKCGDVCPGNAHEICGDENTIVAFQILDSRRTFTYARTPAEPFPNYNYDSCVRLNSFNQSITYQFTIVNQNDFHPRYCLAFCTKYNQKYALINHGQCLCTNSPMKDEEDNVDILTGQSCSQQCQGNYFYSCGDKTNVTIYSLYLLQPKCRHGFEVAENDQQCVYSHFSSKVDSFSSAQTYCQSIGGTLAKLNDIVEIQDILPDSILHTRLMQQLLVYYKFKFVNDSRLYWIDRTSDISDPNTISERLLKQCSKIPESTDRNCITIQYVQNADQTHERCIIETNECSQKSAMPVCVDEHLEVKPTLVPPINDENPSEVSVNITIEHSCDDEYDFIDDHCYRILFHEVNWNQAKSECQRDQAMIFVPEKSVTLQHIKSLFLRRRSYISSGFAHVGVYYDRANRTVIQYNASNTNDDVLTIPDSNAIYDLCEKTFQERYAVLMLSSSLTSNEKNRLKIQQTGCAYIDLLTYSVPTIRCDEIPCNRTATVICQKLPNIKTDTIKIKREYVENPPAADEPDPSLPTVSDNDEPLSSKTTSDDSQFSPDNQDNLKSIGRDFAPIFFILVIFCILILLGLVTTIYNNRGSIFRHSHHRRHTNSVYSQLTSANDFDLT